MRDATKWLCGLLVALMALTGPLLSRAAVVEAAELSSGAVDVRHRRQRRGADRHAGQRLPRCGGHLQGRL